MIELSRFQQLRPPQTVSDEDKLHIGLPLYPDETLSTFANALRAAKNSDDFSTLTNRYNDGKTVLTDTKALKPAIKSLYDWFSFKARPIQLKDFNVFVKTLKADKTLTLKADWIVYADNFVAAIARGVLHVNYCIDFQLLIRVCYVYRECLTANPKGYEVDAAVTEELIQRLLTLPILLPDGVLNSRCRELCCKPLLAAALQPATINASAPCGCQQDREDPCHCEVDMTCQQPNKFCICLKTYVADLFVIKEELARYEEGDIADIENILAGEKKVRTHRTFDRTEDTTQTETDTETSQERDHQVDEKFGLQSEVKNTVDEKVNVDAGVTATLKYGDSVTLTPHANVTANFSKSQSESTARSYSKDLVDRSVTKFQEKVSKLVISKVISEIEERNLHSINNTQTGADHRAGIYYWVNKVTHAQVFGYGRHMMFDAILPEPAAMFKKLYQTKLTNDKAAKAPPEPVVTPGAIRRYDPNNPNDPNYYGNLLEKYGISSSNTDSLQPPAGSVCVEVAFSQNVTRPDDGKCTAFSSNEFKATVPENYAAVRMNYDVRCSTGDPGSTGPDDEVAVSVNVGDQCIFTKSLNEYRDGNQHAQDWSAQGNLLMKGEMGDVTVAVAGFSSVALSLSGSISITCHVTGDAFEKWQTQIYNLIMADYNRKLAAYENSDNNDDQLFQIKGRNPFLNREIERNEFKRHIIALLMCNYFNGIGSMMERVAPCGYPEPNFAKLASDAPVIQFFEQVFEWEYMNYLFYHSMWARKCKWPELIDQDSGDPLFDKFLMAGAARVQVPIRPGMEDVFQWFLETGQIWGASGTPPVSGDPNYVSMIQELKEADQCDYSDRPGLVDVVSGSDQVTLTNSTFYWDLVNDTLDTLALNNDIDREILINFKVYRIVNIVQTNAGDNTTWTITIDKPYPDASAKNLKHAVGAVFVGAPWEVVIPTKLAYLRNTHDKLPVYPLT